MPAIDIQKLDLEVQNLLRKTGEYVKKEFTHFSYDDVKYKGVNDPFTHVDVNTEEILKKACRALIPDCGFITEESDAEQIENEYVWIIDPIDGTVNFTHGIPFFCISIALQHAGEIVMGHIYQPVYDQMFMAIKGKGAKLNGTSMQVSTRKSFEMGVIATGFPYAKKSWVDNYLKLMADIQEKANGIRRFGSAALDLAFVASGRLDGYFEYELNAWDIAAGILMVQEAGGTVTDFAGGNQYLAKKGIIASNTHIHEDLYHLIQQRAISS